MTTKIERIGALTIDQLQRDVRILNRVRSDLAELDVSGVICFFIHDQASVGETLYSFGTDALELSRAGADRDDFADVSAAPAGSDIAVIATVYAAHVAALSMLEPILIEAGVAVAVVRDNNSLTINAKTTKANAATVIKKVNDANVEGASDGPKVVA